jgi:hypothetical protein
MIRGHLVEASVANSDSNLSTGPAVDDAPTKQHHRLATGKKIGGQADPNGGQADTTKKIGNAPCTY